MAIDNFGVINIVGRNKKVIEEYMKNQIQEDIAYVKEYIDQFTGDQVKGSKR